MEIKLNFIKLTTLFLFLEFICALWGAYLTANENQGLFIIIVRTLEHIFLFVYYVLSVKKLNIHISAFIFIALTIGIVSVFNILNVFLIGLLTINRAVLLSYNITKINLKVIKQIVYIFLLVFIALMMITLFVLHYFDHREGLYQNHTMSILLFISGILMLLALVSSIGGLATNLNKSNILFFSAIALFIIADAVFITMDFGTSSPYAIALNDIFYSTSLFLVVFSDIKKI